MWKSICSDHRYVRSLSCHDLFNRSSTGIYHLLFVSLSGTNSRCLLPAVSHPTPLFGYHMVSWCYSSLKVSRIHQQLDVRCHNTQIGDSVASTTQDVCDLFAYWLLVSTLNIVPVLTPPPPHRKQLQVCTYLPTAIPKPPLYVAYFKPALSSLVLGRSNITVMVDWAQNTDLNLTYSLYSVSYTHLTLPTRRWV